MSLRETTPAIVHIDSDTIKVGRGLAELLEIPSATLKACYGFRRVTADGDVPMTAASSSTFTEPEANRPLSDYLVGTALEEALAKDASEVDVYWPFEAGEVEGTLKGMVQEMKTGTGAQVKQEADWRGREAILNHIFYQALQLQPTTNLTTLMLIPPSTQPLAAPHLASYTQLAFETLNVPALHILEPSIAALYGVGASTGLSIQFGNHETVIDAVWEGQTRSDARIVLDVGKQACLTHLSELLSRDPQVKEQVQKFGKEAVGEVAWDGKVEETAYAQLAESILTHEKLKEGKVVNVPLASGDAAHLGLEEEEEEEGVFNVAKVLIKGDADKSIQQLKESKSKKSAAQQAADAAKAEAAALAAAAAARAEAAADLYAFEVPILAGKKVRVGPVRHRACEPLYREVSTIKPAKLGRTVQEGMAAAVNKLEKEFRQQVWESVVFSGQLAKVPSLSFSIVSYLTTFVLPSPEHESEAQPTHVRILKVPDYYANFRGHSTDLAPFLGGSIAAKIAFTDGRDQNCITKAMYNQYGPGASYLAAAME